MGKVKFLETESRMEVAGGRGRYCLMGVGFSLGRLEKLWSGMAVMVVDSVNVLNATELNT